MAARSPRHAGTRRTNVGEAEQWLSLIGGGLLLLTSFRRRTLGGFLLSLLNGAYFVNRGVTGYDPVYAELGIDTAHPSGTGDGTGYRPGSGDEGRQWTGGPSGPSTAQEEVDEAVEESFPASDPPAYTPPSHTGRPPHG
jgi:Protein of unknown function (DUF2892)